MKNIVLGLFLVFMLISCYGGDHKQERLFNEMTVDADSGQMVYHQYCQACHQVSGMGIPKIYPPIKGNPLTSGDKRHFISVLLNGQSGDIEVNGEKYNGVMASFANLTDQQLTDVINYVRVELSGVSDSVNVNDVRELRK